MFLSYGKNRNKVQYSDYLITKQFSCFLEITGLFHPDNEATSSRSGNGALSEGSALPWFPLAFCTSKTCFLSVNKYVSACGREHAGACTLSLRVSLLKDNMW